MALLGWAWSACALHGDMHVGASQLGSELHPGEVKIWLGICRGSICLGMFKKQGGSLHLFIGRVWTMAAGDIQAQQGSQARH